MTLKGVLRHALYKETPVEELLIYLEKKLQIIQTIGASEDQIRFSLDPLAEYLAGLYVIEVYGKHGSQWRKFCDYAAKQQGAPETIMSFLYAVYDCCIEKGNECGVPDWAKGKLALLCHSEDRIVNQ